MNSSKISRRDRLASSLLTFCLVALGGLVLGIGHWGPRGVAGASSGSGSIAVHMSNRSHNSAACKASNLAHVYVTVGSVMAQISGHGSVDLTQGDKPVQIDLLSDPSTDCMLADLGGASGLPSGKYQQIRVIIADTATLANNACSSLGKDVVNCVQLTDNSFAPLGLTSTDKTGIKIPPGQFGGGGLNLAPGEGVDLDIDFNACQSIVATGATKKGSHGHGGSGKFMLKPTLNASEIGLSPLIAGSVKLSAVSGSTVATPGSTPAAGANVWLEQIPAAANFTEGTPAASPSATPGVSVNNVVAETTSDANGDFVFCPVPAGTYEIVTDSNPTASLGNVPSDGTIATGVTVTSKGGPNNLVVPMISQPAASASPSSLSGEFTTTVDGTNAGSGDDILFGGTQSFNSGANQAKVPPLTGTGSNPVTTGPGVGKCASGTAINCNMATFTLAVPDGNPVIGAANATGGGYAAPAAGDVNYAIIGTASVKGSATSACSPSKLTTASLDVTASPLPTPTLSFTGCN